MEDFGKSRREGDTPPAIHLAQCRLTVVKGPQRGKEYVFSGDVIRIGKADDNDLVVPEETVSRVHLEILRDAKGYLLRDLQSTNGTFLDGAEIREAYIGAGSVITVGLVQLKFQPSEERIEIAPSPRESCGELVGRSPRMRELFGLIERLAPTEATVLVEGERGTGKDLVARTIHGSSRRKGGPFIVVDCAAVSGHALESELFGHEKGAFPGAQTARQGAFELAHGGTLLLDEVGELSLDHQPKLLRVLEQRELRRLGGNRPINVDVRVIATSRSDLKREAEQGKFREDLYFRLSVVPIRLPPLRERREDIPLLHRQAVARLGAAGRQVAADPAGEAALALHDWPGNVRELLSVIERGAPLGGLAAVLSQSVMTGALEFDPHLSYRAEKERWERDFERRYLGWLLARAHGNISRAAREADMDRKYLHKLLKKHRIVT
ncbi:MAG: sigma 54-dependent Fis family transcriptional regulator [Myxococcales bacterium]|nr:sigma 54-dependent Fis family transcriptional regulator [Myxococcales bacterium]